MTQQQTQQKLNDYKTGLENDLIDLRSDIKILNIGYPDEYIKHASVSQIEEKYGIDVDSIIKRIKIFLENNDAK